MSSKTHLGVSGTESGKCELGDSLPQSASKLQGYVRSICRMYARRLRHEYNLGYIALVDWRINIPSWLPEGLVYTIKRVKYHPIWMPTLKLLY
jgi:hypothetical protein